MSGYHLLVDAICSFQRAFPEPVTWIGLVACRPLKQDFAHPISCQSKQRRCKGRLVSGVSVNSRKHMWRCPSSACTPQGCRVPGAHWQCWAALQARRAATPGPSWTCSSASRASAQRWEARSQGDAAAPERGFHLCALFSVPRPDFFPGKHFSQSSDKDSFLLLLSTNDSFLIAFSVGSWNSFLKTCLNSSYEIQGFM